MDAAAMVDLAGKFSPEVYAEGWRMTATKQPIAQLDAAHGVSSRTPRPSRPRRA